MFVWAKVNERVFGGYPLGQATIRVSRDPELGTVDPLEGPAAGRARPGRQAAAPGQPQVSRS